MGITDHSFGYRKLAENACLKPTTTKALVQQETVLTTISSCPKTRTGSSVGERNTLNKINVNKYNIIILIINITSFIYNYDTVILGVQINSCGFARDDVTTVSFQRSVFISMRWKAIISRY